MRRALLAALALVVAVSGQGYGGVDRSAEAGRKLAQNQPLGTKKFRYRAFGERVTLSGGAPNRTDPSFQNRTYDAGLGIYDYRNRRFDPVTGRFLQRDPVLGGDPLYNPYCFPGNNPVSHGDPFGLGHWVELKLMDKDGKPVNPPVRVYVLDEGEDPNEAANKEFPDEAAHGQDYSVPTGLKPFDPKSADSARRYAAKLGYTDIDYMSFKTMYLGKKADIEKIAENKTYWTNQAAAKNDPINKAIADRRAAKKAQEEAEAKVAKWLAPRRRGHAPDNPWKCDLTTKKGLADWVKQTTGLTIDPSIVDIGDKDAAFDVHLSPLGRMKVAGFDLTKTEHQSIVLSGLIHEAAAMAKAKAMGIDCVEANKQLGGYVSGLHDWGIYYELKYQDKTGIPMDQGYLDDSLPLKLSFVMGAERTRNYNVLNKMLMDYSNGKATSGELEITGMTIISTRKEKIALDALPGAP